MRARQIRVTLAVAMMMAVLAGAASMLGAGEGDPLATALEKSGLKFTPLSGNSGAWEVPFTGKDGKSFKVYVTYNDDSRAYALIFSTVVNKPDSYQFSRDLLIEAMKISNDTPGIKFCLDIKHGDIDVQSEVLMTTVTPDVLKSFINLVATMADKHRQALNDLAR